MRLAKSHLLRVSKGTSAVQVIIAFELQADCQERTEESQNIVTAHLPGNQNCVFLGFCP